MAYEQAATVATEPTNCFFDHEDLKLHYLDWGGDPKQRTFVLLHGGGAHAHWWDYVAPELVPMVTSSRSISAAMDAARGHLMPTMARPHTFMMFAR